MMGSERSARLRSLLAPAVATVLAGALLVGLGVWQLHRLAWKEGLIAQIEARSTAPPQPLPQESRWNALRPSEYEYTHVTARGTFDKDKATLVFRPSEDGPGYLVMTPLKLSDRPGTVIIDRGWVPESMKDSFARVASAPSGVVDITGLMRAPEPRNLFTPADDEKTGQFFTKDPRTIAAYDGISAAPFLVDADASPPNPGGWPRGGAAVLSIPNNHFSYAMTWFGLALTLIGVFCSFAWKRLTIDPEAAATSDEARASAGAR